VVRDGTQLQPRPLVHCREAARNSNVRYRLQPPSVLSPNLAFDGVSLNQPDLAPATGDLPCLPSNQRRPSRERHLRGRSWGTRHDRPRSPQPPGQVHRDLITGTGAPDAKLHPLRACGSAGTTNIPVPAAAAGQFLLLGIAACEHRDFTRQFHPRIVPRSLHQHLAILRRRRDQCHPANGLSQIPD